MCDPHSPCPGWRLGRIDVALARPRKIPATGHLEAWRREDFGESRTYCSSASWNSRGRALNCQMGKRVQEVPGFSGARSQRGAAGEECAWTNWTHSSKTQAFSGIVRAWTSTAGELITDSGLVIFLDTHNQPAMQPGTRDHRGPQIPALLQGDARRPGLSRRRLPPSSGFYDEAVDDALAAGVVELDGELVAVHLGHGAGAELLMPDARCRHCSPRPGRRSRRRSISPFDHDRRLVRTPAGLAPADRHRAKPRLRLLRLRPAASRVSHSLDREMSSAPRRSGFCRTGCGQSRRSRTDCRSSDRRRRTGSWPPTTSTSTLGQVIDEA